MFDREQMKKSIFRGFAEVANDRPLAPSNRYYSADVPQRPYDPEKAEFHLKKADALDSPLQIVASVAADNSVEMAVVMQQTAQKIVLIGESVSGKTTIALSVMGYARSGCRIAGDRVRLGDAFNPSRTIMAGVQGVEPPTDLLSRADRRRARPAGVHCSIWSSCRAGWRTANRANCRAGRSSASIWPARSPPNRT